MKNVLWFILTSILVLGCTSKNEDPDQKLPEITLPSQPNILWLVAEDLSPYLPSFGDSTIKTPNISRLADEGVRYTNVYSPSGVCSPSRFALSTGTYPTSGGGHNMRTLFGELEQIGLIPYEVVTPPDVKMMSQVLRENGYYCTNNAKGDYQYLATVTAWDESSMRAHWRNRPEGKPFFSIFNFDITHESQFFGPPMKRNKRFSGDFPENVRNYNWGDRIDSSEWHLNVPPDLDVDVPPYLPDVEKVRNDMRVMYSNIIEMDKQVGFLLNQLEEDGLLENTIVVWYTDHGGPLPRQKRLMYDAGLKVPMIIRYPGAQRAGTVDDQLISFIDFAPTTFSFADIGIPGYIEGQAFSGPLKAAQPRNYIHAGADRLDEYIDMIRAVKDKRYKYLLNLKPEQGYYLPLAYREQIISMKVLLEMRDNNELNDVQMQWFRDSKPDEELFDTWNDPHEIQNIADDPEYQEKLEELRAECARWMKETNDKGFIPEADLISQFWPGNLQPVTKLPVVSITGIKAHVISETDGSSIGYQLVSPEQRLGDIWKVYTQPLDVDTTQILYVIADRIGYKPSKVVRFDF